MCTVLIVKKKIQHYYGFALQASNMVDFNGCASSRNSMAVVHTMKIQTNIQEDGACDRLGMESNLPNWNHKT